MAQEEQIKAFETMLDKLDTLLENDEDIAVNSVDEIKDMFNEHCKVILEN